jgi:hypothetical protein
MTKIMYDKAMRSIKGFVIVFVILALAGCTKKQDVVQQPKEQDAALQDENSQENKNLANADYYEYRILDEGEVIEIIGYFGNNANIIIPDTVTHIGNELFMDKAIESVVFPESLLVIGHFAFSDNLLTEITIPEGVVSIGERAFFNNSLTSVVLPKSVIAVDVFAFASNPITSITIGDDVELLAVSLGGYLGKTYVFDNEFDDFYEANGKKAGTYIFADWQWTYNLTDKE